MQMYLGFYIPYAYPEVNPYPLAVGGSGLDLVPNWTTVDMRNSNFWNNYNATANVGNLEIFEGLGPTTRYVNEAADNNSDGTGAYSIQQGTVYPWAQRGTHKLRKNIDGTFPVIRARLQNFTGELSGVNATTGADGNVAENILYNSTLNKKYVVFRNHNRTGVRNYCAMELS
jgi:hypothetical protein